MYVCMYIYFSSCKNPPLTEEAYDDMFVNLSKNTREYELPMPVRLDELVDILSDIWDHASA